MGIFLTPIMTLWFISRLILLPVNDPFTSPPCRFWQDTVYPPPGADTAVLLTALTCTYLAATTLTLRRQAAQRMKTTLFSGNFGGFILPQPPGSRFEQRVICPQNWPPCLVRTDVLALIYLEKHAWHTATCSHWHPATGINLSFFIEQ